MWSRLLVLVANSSHVKCLPSAKPLTHSHLWRTNGLTRWTFLNINDKGILQKITVLKLLICWVWQSVSIYCSPFTMFDWKTNERNVCSKLTDFVHSRRKWVTFPGDIFIYSFLLYVIIPLGPPAIGLQAQFIFQNVLSRNCWFITSRKTNKSFGSHCVVCVVVISGV